MKIKYVGAKTGGERAFKEETGIEWFQGDVHDVNPEHAAKMLRHPDVFEAADSKASLASAKVPEQVKVPEGSGDVDPLAGMDDAAVRAFVKEQKLSVKSYGVLKGDNLRAKVMAALAEKK